MCGDPKENTLYILAACSKQAFARVLEYRHRSQSSLLRSSIHIRVPMKKPEACSGFFIGEPDDTKVEHLVTSLHMLNNRLEELGIVGVNDEITETV
jgi:hypothetical protein